MREWGGLRVASLAICAMTVLDPEPTLFGTGKIDPLVGPDGTDEYQRAIQWINNRAARYAFGARIRVLLLGDAIAAYNLNAGFQPILDWLNDQQDPPYEDFTYDDPANNWSSNS